MAQEEEREFPLPAEGHALPAADWKEVVANAAKFREESDESETD